MALEAAAYRFNRGPGPIKKTISLNLWLGGPEPLPVRNVAPVPGADDDVAVSQEDGIVRVRAPHRA